MARSIVISKAVIVDVQQAPFKYLIFTVYILVRI